MIDAKLLRETPDVVRAALTKRGESTDLVDQILVADGERRSSISAFEALRAEQKSLGKQVAQAKGDERTALLDRTKTLAAEVKANEAAANDAARRFDELAAALPNLVSDEALVGGEDDFVVVEEVGKPRTSPPRASSPATTWRWASCSARSTWNAARRSADRGSTSSRAPGCCSSSACSSWPSSRRWRTASPR